MFFHFSVLKDEERKRQREHRCLILGCGEAGKSTFIKQMHIIQSKGFTDEYKMAKKNDIAKNIIDAMQTLIAKMLFVEESAFFEDQQLSEAYGRFQEKSSSYDPKIVFELAEDIKIMWKSQPIQSTYERRHQFQLVDCAAYFLDTVETVMSPDYLPSG